MTVDLDAELRAALDEAVADVHPTDTLWRRIEASTELAPVRRIGPPVRPPSRRYLIVAVAAAAAVLAGAVALWQREEAAPLVQTNPRPQPSVVTTPAPTEPTATTVPSVPGPHPAAVSPTPTSPSASEPRPTRAVAMLQDGRMVEADLATGTVLRVLDTRWDVNKPAPTGDIAYWGSVDVDPGGNTVWYTDCCLPANGRLFRGRLDAWPAQAPDFGQFKAVAVSPDSAWVARAEDDITVTAPDGRTVARYHDPQLGGGVRLWWSPDRKLLVYATSPPDPTSGQMVIHVLRWDGRTLQADPGSAPVAGSAIRWDGDRMVVLAVEARSSQTSADGAWTLVVDSTGQAQLLDATGAETPVLPGLKLLAADIIETERGS